MEKVSSLIVNEEDIKGMQIYRVADDVVIKFDEYTNFVFHNNSFSHFIEELRCARVSLFAPKDS